MHRLDETTIKLLEYCKKHDWAGYDPYDALNSRIFARESFYRSRIMRIAATQIMKRLPINLRPLLAIPKEQNPKAIALFLMASLKLQRLGLIFSGDFSAQLIENLAALRSLDTPYWCWGYSFPWQTRTNLVPRGAPNLVCTTFVANALLDAYEIKEDSQCLTMATSAAEYILNDLYWVDRDDVAGFSYPLPGLRARVHNANFLGAALFGRIHKHSGDKRYLETALKITRYSAGRQRPDGSWLYGELPTQSWVDNFHTGYNLLSLRSMSESIPTTEFDSALRKGFDFYQKHFFREDGAPRYFHDRTFPVDVHSVALSIITLLELKDLDGSNVDLARSVFAWAMDHLWDEEGYFYYRKLPLYTNKISYMRWSQAWMLLALATFIEELNTERTQVVGMASMTGNEITA